MNSSSSTNQNMTLMDEHPNTMNQWFDKISNEQNSTEKASSEDGIEMNAGEKQQKRQRKSLKDILPKLNQQQVTCNFSMDDQVDKELEMLSEEEDLWTLPHFNEDHEDFEMVEETNQQQHSLQNVLSKFGSINSNSTCDSNFGTSFADQAEMIDEFTGNFGYVNTMDPSLKLRRCDAVYPPKSTTKHNKFTVQEAQEMASDSLYEAFFGQSIEINEVGPL